MAEYWGAGVYGDSDWRGNSFETVLQPDGTILLQYSELSHAPTAPTGIENLDGSQGLTYTVPLTYGLAVAFIPDQADIPWLTLSTMAGTTSGESATPILATFDANGLTAGVYTGRLLVYSNDPDQPLANLPVTFNVQAVPSFRKVFLPVVTKGFS